MFRIIILLVWKIELNVRTNKVLHVSCGSHVEFSDLLKF